LPLQESNNVLTDVGIAPHRLQTVVDAGFPTRGLKTKSISHSGPPPREAHSYIFARPGTYHRFGHWLWMERIYLIVACVSIVLLTTAVGVASAPLNGGLDPAKSPLLLRIMPR